MPRRDGTGPIGYGAMTGRGLGPCAGARAVGNAGFRMGPGLGFRRGFGRGFGGNVDVSQISSETQKELLEEQKNVLQEQLEAIDRQLQSL